MPRWHARPYNQSYICIPNTIKTGQSSTENFFSFAKVLNKESISPVEGLVAKISSIIWVAVIGNILATFPNTVDICR